MKNIAGFFLMVFFLISCSSQKTITLSDLSQLKFINEYDVPYNKNLSEYYGWGIVRN